MAKLFLKYCLSGEISPNLVSLVVFVVVVFVVVVNKQNYSDFVRSNLHARMPQPLCPVDDNKSKIHILEQKRRNERTYYIIIIIVLSIVVRCWQVVPKSKKWAFPASFIIYFRSFETKNTFFYKTVHTVSSAGI